MESLKLHPPLLGVGDCDHCPTDSRNYPEGSRVVINKQVEQKPVEKPFIKEREEALD